MIADARGTRTRESAGIEALIAAADARSRNAGIASRAWPG